MEPTRINAHLTLREYRGGIRYGTDALLLASFFRGGRRARCADLGTGCGVIPLLLLILMFSLESRLVFLVLWIVSLIVICGYLICVEYIHDKMHRQLEINGMTVEDLAKSIKEEKER